MKSLFVQTEYNKVTVFNSQNWPEIILWSFRSRFRFDTFEQPSNQINGFLESTEDSFI